MSVDYSGNVSGFNPTPGPKNPGKYPRVGPAYSYYGEQPGWTYNYVNDTYIPNKTDLQGVYGEAGYGEEKKPSTWDRYGQVFGTAGATGLAYAIAQNPKAVFGGVKDAGTSAYESVRGAFTPETTPAAPPAPTTPSGGSGLLSTPPPGSAPTPPVGAPPSAPTGIAGNGAGLFANATPMGAEATASLGAEAGSTADFIAQGYDAAADLGGTATSVAPTATNTFGVLGGLGSTIGLAGQAYYYGMQAKDAYEDMQSARTGAKGQIKAALLSTGPFAGWLAPVVDFLPISSGKHPDQYRRDALRDHLVNNNIISQDYKLENADGSIFDVGLDGAAKLVGADGKERHYYDVDLSDESALQLIPEASVLGAILSGGDKKLTSDAAGYFVNAAKSSGDGQQNIMSYFSRAGLDHDTAYGIVHAMTQPGEKGEKPRLTNEQADVFKDTLDRMYGVGAYSGKGPQFAAPVPVPNAQEIPKEQVTQPQQPQQGGVSLEQRVTRPANQGLLTGAKPFTTSTPQGATATAPRAADVFQGGPQRISPGVWQDAKGTYQSKTGVRGK